MLSPSIEGLMSYFWDTCPSSLPTLEQCQKVWLSKLDYSHGTMAGLTAMVASVPIGMLARKIRRMVTLNDQRVEQLQVKIDDLTKLLADQEKVEKNLFGRMANLHLDINTYEKDLVYVNAKNRDLSERVAEIMNFLGKSEVISDQLQDMVSLSLTLLDDYSKNLVIVNELKTVLDKENVFLQGQVISLSEVIQLKENDYAVLQNKLKKELEAREVVIEALKVENDMLAMAFDSYKMEARGSLEGVKSECKEKLIAKENEADNFKKQILELEKVISLYETAHVDKKAVTSHGWKSLNKDLAKATDHCARYKRCAEKLYIELLEIKAKNGNYDCEQNVQTEGGMPPDRDPIDELAQITHPLTLNGKVSDGSLRKPHGETVRLPEKQVPAARRGSLEKVKSASPKLQSPERVKSGIPKLQSPERVKSGIPRLQSPEKVKLGITSKTIAN